MIKLKDRWEAFRRGKAKDNIYRVKGAVPSNRLLGFGLQQMLVMFMSNLTPILVTLSVFNQHSVTQAGISAALLWAGLGTLLQIYPLWRFGSGLPNMMGTSFTFIGALLIVGEKYGYWTMLGSAIVGGLFLFVMGFFAKYWRRLIKPVTSAAVMIAVGLELAVLGAQQFFSYDKVISLDPNEIYSFQTAWPLLLISAFTLIVALLWNSLVHGSKKYMHISVGLLAGYLLALVFNVCFPSLKIFDYSQYSFKTINDVFHVPLVVDFSQIKFEWAPILFVCITYLVSSSESISDMVATAHAAYGRGASDRELAGGLVVDGLISTISACFGSVPITTSTENVGYMGKTGIINKHVVGTGAVMMVILSFFPQVAVFLEQIPTAAIGGCMLTIYMSILVLGFEMLSRAGFTKKNVMVISVALGLGYGTSLLPVNFFNTITFPDGWVFVGFLMENPEVSVFLLALILSWAIPGGSNDRMVPFEKEELALAEVKEEKDIKEEDEKHDLKQSPAPTESNSNHS